ncbi:MAG: mechanosensitive ion channel [Candidatus Promineifilaceae bacterium]|nr:mechanosensitive ion channel [Candidatus Promineifilaceae bacterium]
MRKRTLLLLLAPFVIVFILLILFIGLLQTIGISSFTLVTSLTEIGTEPRIVSQTQLISDTLARFSLPIRILLIPILFLIALVFHRLNWRIAGWLLDSAITNAVRSPASIMNGDSEQDKVAKKSAYTPQHRQTLQYLVASVISLLAFGTAILLTMLQFINTAGMAVIATVASTALGFGTRDYINDLIMGISAIFEDNFDVGEKIEVIRVLNPLQGNVKKVNIRTALLQTPEGIPITIPHGEIRVFHNFSRGIHSGTTVTFQVPSHNLAQSLEVLHTLVDESPALFPELVEPLKLISRSGVVGAQTELTIIGKAHYGQGVDLRLDLLSTIESRLEELNLRPGEHE